MRGRPKKVFAVQEIPQTPEQEEYNLIDPDPIVPEGWRKGALLNVRNYGAEYIITLWPEEYSPEHPERSIQIRNPGICQDFISKWYAAEHHDPRAR